MEIKKEESRLKHKLYSAKEKVRAKDEKISFLPKQLKDLKNKNEVALSELSFSRTDSKTNPSRAAL